MPSPLSPEPSDSALEISPLYKAMCQCIPIFYENRAEVLESIREMRARVANGEDPEEVLHEEGFEPDFVFDLI